MSDELNAYERLQLLGAISPTELFSPAKSKEGAYTALLKSKLAECDLTPRGSDVGKVVSASSLREGRRPQEWIIDEIAADACCVLLAAEKGSGKTSLIYAMAHAVSQGELFMGQLPTNRRKTLVIQADESKNDAIEKLDAMGIEAATDFDFFFPEEHGWSGLEKPKLRQLVKDGDYGAVFLDSVTTLLGNGVQGVRMNDPEFAKPLYELNHLACELGFLAVITSHLRKADGHIPRPASADDVLGAGTLTAAVSDIWYLQRAQKPEFPEHYILQCLGKRNCHRGTAWNLEGSQEDFSWVLRSVADPNDVLPERRRELKVQIVELLNSYDGWLHATQIATCLSCDPEHARRLLRNLSSEQKISKTKAESTGGRPAWRYGKGLFLHDPH